MTCATFTLRLLKASTLPSPPKASSCIKITTKVNTLETPYIYNPFLRWTQYTSPSGAMEQQSIHIACSNHYWSERKALLLHTPTNSATQGKPILLRPSTTSATHLATIQICSPSFGEECTHSTRAYIIYISIYRGERKGKSSAQSLTRRAFQ